MAPVAEALLPSWVRVARRAAGPRTPAAVRFVRPIMGPCRPTPNSPWTAESRALWASLSGGNTAGGSARGRPAGNTLKILGMRDACREINSTESIPKDIREIIEISPIPKNMHPKIHKARRKARSEAHERYFARRKDVLYVDATTYKEHSGAVVSLVDHQLREINCASIKGNNILEVEEAIALAITHQGEEATTEILTDSQEASVQQWTHIYCGHPHTQDEKNHLLEMLHYVDTRP
ncbi:hypothetical protein HPB49_002373 [Dermacentor silvarum]|uniref:Uncharacterized protein n=1 Tax=Dermacentor silvarum TaxID=543639 RepID=A0ACB8CUK6_DERSI|nr:hypothetical protein HPB49_002373 [Dermacentor silvarum]